MVNHLHSIADLQKHRVMWLSLWTPICKIVRTRSPNYTGWLRKTATIWFRAGNRKDMIQYQRHCRPSYSTPLHAKSRASRICTILTAGWRPIAKRSSNILKSMVRCTVISLIWQRMPDSRKSVKRWYTIRHANTEQPNSDWTALLTDTWTCFLFGSFPSSESSPCIFSVC